MVKPGICIITYKRPVYLKRCLEKIFKYTNCDFQIAVASDCVDDRETEGVCSSFNVPLIKGDNRGVVWNKNRGLYYFMSRTNCDPILLLEDDTYPTSENWLQEWIDAAQRWHHVNHTIPALLNAKQALLGGNGTPQDPYVHTLVSGQCTAVSRHAIDRAGYLNTRFQGYGHGHVEWTQRHIKLVPQATDNRFHSERMTYVSIIGGLKSEDAPSFRNQEDVERNGRLLASLTTKYPKYQHPWNSFEEKNILEDEVSLQLNKLEPKKWNTSNEKYKKSNKPHRGNIDRVTVGEKYSIIEGWSIDKNGGKIDNIDVFIDGNNINHSLSTIKRPDVVKSIPDAAIECGFIIEFDSALVPYRKINIDLVDSSTGCNVGNSVLFDGSKAHRISLPKIPETPSMPETSISAIRAVMDDSRCYLEYGTGGSTIMASKLGNLQTICVESDEVWLNAVKAHLDAPEFSDRFHFLHADIGPTREWGYPVSESAIKQWSDYPLGVWKYMAQRGISPDLILIDGRFRRACFLASLIFARPGTRIFFDDYLDRPFYHTVETFLKPERTVDRVAEFIRPQEIDNNAVWLALVEATMDVR